MATTAACPLCAHRGGFRVYGERDVLRLLVCPACAFVFADREHWRDPYRARDYYETNPLPAAYPLRPDATSRERVAAVRRLSPHGRWLDFGGGLGQTAVAAAAAGYEVTVVEASRLAVTRGRRHHPEGAVAPG